MHVFVLVCLAAFVAKDMLKATITEQPELVCSILIPHMVYWPAVACLLLFALIRTWAAIYPMHFIQGYKHKDIANVFVYFFLSPLSNFNVCLPPPETCVVFYDHFLMLVLITQINHEFYYQMIKIFLASLSLVALVFQILMKKGHCDSGIAYALLVFGTGLDFQKNPFKKNEVNIFQTTATLLSIIACTLIVISDTIIGLRRRKPKNLMYTVKLNRRMKNRVIPLNVRKLNLELDDTKQKTKNEPWTLNQNQTDQPKLMEAACSPTASTSRKYELLTSNSITISSNNIKLIRVKPALLKRNSKIIHLQNISYQAGFKE